jgi:hypothetical protein
MFQQEDKPKKSYMQELDDWTNAEVIVPMMHAVRSGDEQTFSETARTVERAIRAKVLDSYHNGQKAGPRKATNRPGL